MNSSSGGQKETKKEKGLKRGAGGEKKGGEGHKKEEKMRGDPEWGTEAFLWGNRSCFQGKVS